MESLKAMAMAPVNKIRDALKEGLTPKEVALSLACGIACESSNHASSRPKRA